MRKLSVLFAFAVIMATVLGILPAASTPAHASTCGGNIVARTNTNYQGHYAIYVDTGGLYPAITRIEYWNGRSYELVPNSGSGVDYSHPIGQEGRLFVYGVSTRWTWTHPGWTWTYKWRVWYNC